MPTFTYAQLFLLTFLLLFGRFHAQSDQLKLDYFPLAVIADFYPLKGVKEVTILNTLILGKDTVLNKEEVQWFRYRNDSTIAWMSKKIYAEGNKLKFAFEERYEDKCMIYRKKSYHYDVEDKYWSKHCRYSEGKSFYQIESNYAGDQVLRRKEIKNTLVNETTLKFRWREWSYDTLLVDSSKVHKIIKYTNAKEEVQEKEPIHPNSVFMTRDKSGKPFRYSNDTYNGAYDEHEAWDYVYKSGEANAWRVDYSKWSEVSTYGPVQAIWLENYSGGIPTRATYRKKDWRQEIEFIVEVIIK